MKLFKKKARNNETPVMYSYPEVGRIPSDFPISKFILDDFSHAEANDKKLFGQVKGLDTYNARMQDPSISAKYNLERSNAYEHNLNNLETLLAINMTNMGVWKEALEIDKLLENDYKRNSKELELFENLHSADGRKEGKQ